MAKKSTVQHAALGDKIPPSAGTQKPIGVSVCGMIRWTSPTSLREAQAARREGTETCAKCRDKLWEPRHKALAQAACVVAKRDFYKSEIEFDCAYDGDTGQAKIAVVIRPTEDKA